MNVLIITSIISFLISALGGPFFIRWISKKQFGQNIREDGPKSHQKKKGTPIFGGFIFLIPVAVLSLLFMDKNYQFWFLFTLMMGYGAIGFADDFIKVFLKRNLGLTAKQKIIAQGILAITGYLILLSGHHDTHVYITGTSLSFDLSYFYFIFFIFLTIGTSNATNLTDGLDGLLGGLMAIALAVYAFISFQTNQTESLYFSCFMAASLIAFLLFNRNPARIFMGDTGSLALGGLLVGIAILTKTELLLVIIGGVFVVETLSVIIQVLFFKKTGKRIFKMAPLHHHYELQGWSEQKVVSIFYTVGMILGIISIFIGG